MKQNKTNPKRIPVRLKFTPRRKDLKAATSPVGRLLTWLRNWSFVYRYGNTVLGGSVSGRSTDSTASFGIL